ncbi:MAG: HD-GYP domain-containing protein, partial [Candidatus Krumholzibacteria bacterium]|nr:HD-GYP domain-containing protein [Candidatus Krumholzibacteria bacterium]
GLSDQRSPVRVWKTNYLWNLRHLLAFVPFTAIIVLVYKIAPWTLALFIIPLLLIKYAYKLYLDQREVHISTLSALATALDAKDPYTHGHSYRVSRYALLVGEGLGLADSQMQVLEYAALLHDIGKIGIQGSIISKPGKLTEAEFEDMKRHPAIGAEILQRLKFLEESARVVKFHHERPDGKGYPEGISGEEIPLMARILHLCDTFDAMTSNRPYRQALSVERAIEEMKKYRGSQFDPEVVDVFVGFYNRGELEIIHEDIPFEVYDALNEA